MDGMAGYWLFRTAPEAGGGIGRRGETVGDAVRVYIDVDDLEAAVAAATANGGSVITPPSDIPGPGSVRGRPRHRRATRSGCTRGHPRLTPLVDSHCHLNADRFESDADQVIGGARLAGLERILVPGWNVASSERALDLRRSVRLARRGRRDPSARRGQGGRGGVGEDRRAGARTRGSWPSARPGSTTTGSSARSRTS